MKTSAEADFFPAMLSYNTLRVNPFRWKSHFRSCSLRHFAAATASHSTPQLSNFNAMLRSHVTSTEEVTSKHLGNTWGSENITVQRQKETNPAAAPMKEDIQRQISRGWKKSDHFTVLNAFKRARYNIFSRRNFASVIG